MRMIRNEASKKQSTSSVLVNENVNEISLISEITAESAALLTTHVQTFIKEKEKHLTVKIFSGGGDLDYSLYLYDELKNLGKKIEITTRACGSVGSGAVLLLLAGEIRTINRSGFIMLHHPQVDVYGTYQVHSSYMEAVTQNVARMWNIISKHTRLSKGHLDSKINEKGELWLPAKTALKVGLVTKIV